MDPVPLSQVFSLSAERTLGFKATDWLSQLDNSTIERIIESGEQFMTLGDDDDAPFECLDYLTLAYMIGEFETNEDSENFSEQTKENCLVGLSIFAHCENLRKLGLVQFVGEGTISTFKDGETNIELTEDGRAVGGSIKTMLDLSKAIDSD